MKQGKNKLLPPLPQSTPNYMKPKNQSVKPPSLLNHTLNPSIPSNPKYDNTHAIMWFRRKFSKSQIASTVNSLLISQPSQYKSSAPLLKRSHSSQSPLHLDIRYLFQHSIYIKILKLRELFLDFDRDVNKMMEVGELETMFNENNIKVTKAELISLFFKRSYSTSSAKKRKFNLTFHQFIDFCLSQDQEFRLFMRKLKRNSTDKEHFFPMNFNALLDYFIIKGEERKAQKKIINVIDVMEKVVNGGNKVMLTEVNDERNGRRADVVDFGDVMNQFDNLLVLAQSDSIKKKRAISAIAQKRLRINGVQSKGCRNLFANSVLVNVKDKAIL